MVSTPDARRLDRAFASLDFMVAIDIYRNETTKHADVILPSPRVLTKSHYDLALYSLAIRNVANYSPPVVECTGDEVPEWETMLRLAAVVAGQGTSVEAAMALDDFALLTVVQKAVTRSGSPIEGRDAGELIDELSPNGRRGPERVLDFMLRTGAYGDQFGAPGHEGGLSLAVLEANPHGVDLGPLQPRLPEVLKTPSGTIELAPEVIVADVEAAARPVARPARERRDGARRPARPAVEQLVDAQRRDPREGQAALHAPDPPDRRDALRRRSTARPPACGRASVRSRSRPR